MSTQPDHDANIQAYYSLGHEDARLTTRSVGGRLEYERVRRIVSAHLAPGTRVLDVGGGTGVHSRWLAEAGHEVTLLDPVASQVEVAAGHGGFEALVGDARDLPVPDRSADAVLLFGPLYHLVSVEDRRAALDEARRALRPGGLVFAQGISRLTAFVDTTVAGGYDALEPPDLEILRTGEWTSAGEGFPGGPFHTAAELREEVERSGFEEVEVHGLEGPNVGALEALAAGDELVRLGLELVETLEQQLGAAGHSPELLADYSPHMMAVGRAPRR